MWEAVATLLCPLAGEMGLDDSALCCKLYRILHRPVFVTESAQQSLLVLKASKSLGSLPFPVVPCTTLRSYGSGMLSVVFTSFLVFLV